MVYIKNVHGVWWKVDIRKWCFKNINHVVDKYWTCIEKCSSCIGKIYNMYEKKIVNHVLETCQTWIRKNVSMYIKNVQYVWKKVDIKTFVKNA